MANAHGGELNLVWVCDDVGDLLLRVGSL